MTSRIRPRLQAIDAGRQKVEDDYKPCSAIARMNNLQLRKGRSIIDLKRIIM